MTHQILWPAAADMGVGPIQDYIDVHGLLEKVITLVDPRSTEGRPSNILLNGHHGLGKTLLAANLTLRLSDLLGKTIPMVTFDCAEDTFELMLIGNSKVVAGGETPFVPGPFPSTIHLANEVGVCVFCIEEISALPPGAQKVFNRLTDWRNGIYVADVNKQIRLNPGCFVIIIATMNPAGYGGVYSLNDDLRSRFDEVLVPFPTKAQEAKILKSVCPFASSRMIDDAIKVAEASRSTAMSYSLSTRDLVRLLSNYKRLSSQGHDPSFALEVLSNKFEGSDRNTMLDRIDGVFSTKLRHTLGTT